MGFFPTLVGHGGLQGRRGLSAYRVMTVDPAGKNLYAARYMTHGGDIRTISSVG